MRKSMTLKEQTVRMIDNRLALYLPTSLPLDCAHYSKNIPPEEAELEVSTIILDLVGEEDNLPTNNRVIIIDMQQCKRPLYVV